MLEAVLYIALCISFASAQTEPYWPCPNPIEFSPCTCTADVDLVMDVDCSDVSDEETLAKAFQSPMAFCAYRSLKIVGSDSTNFIKFTVDTFGCASFETIQISGTGLQVIEDGTLFRSENTLTSLNLGNNAIRTFPFESLSGFTVLKELMLNDNSLTTVQKIASPSLVTLSLDNNPNLDISLGLFEDVAELETLGMSNCGLTDFTEDMFLPLKKIVTLDLSGNLFDELKPLSIRLFGNTLKSLDLSNNPLAIVGVGAISGLDYPEVSLAFANTKLVELDEASWNDYFANIKEGGIDLSDTLLRCGCDVAWLFTADSLYLKLTPTTQCMDGANMQGLDKCVFEMHCDIQHTADCGSLE